MRKIKLEKLSKEELSFVNDFCKELIFTLLLCENKKILCKNNSGKIWIKR